MRLLIAAMLLCGLVGCEGDSGEAPKPAKQPQQAPGRAPVAPPGVAIPGASEKAGGQAPAAAPAGDVPGQVTVKAQVGAGAKGRGYGGGVVTEPIAASFRVREQLAFGQVQHAVQLYKATNGEAPKTHAEFMEKIIKANNLKLPELPPGHQYLYDPAREELMVRKPADAGRE